MSAEAARLRKHRVEMARALSDNITLQEARKRIAIEERVALARRARGDSPSPDLAALGHRHVRSLAHPGDGPAVVPPPRGEGRGAASVVDGPVSAVGLSWPAEQALIALHCGLPVDIDKRTERGLILRGLIEIVPQIDWVDRHLVPELTDEGRPVAAALHAQQLENARYLRAQGARRSIRGRRA